jgi:general secretion pathway protein G
MNTPRTQRGFSLIEIMVVLAILAIVAGAAVPLVGKNVTRGKIAETRAELAAFPAAVSAYFEDTGALPPTFDDLQQNLAGASGWAGPYLLAMLSANASTTTSLEQDAWSRDYVVAVTGASSLTVTSHGPDGATGGGDDIAQAVDVTPVRRAQTLAELKTINAAIGAYNALNLPGSPLPSDYPSILSTLVTGGYLPGGTSAYDTDGWGSAYAPDPPAASPVVAVASPNV